MCAYHIQRVVLGVKTFPNKVPLNIMYYHKPTHLYCIWLQCVTTTIQQTMAAPHTSYEPLPRAGHAAVAVDNKLHMWGGWAGSEEKSREAAQNIEMFDISTELWEQKPTRGAPPALCDTAYTVVGSCLFVFGGYDGNSYNDSLLKLDLHTFQWEHVQVSNPSSGPQRKRGCRMVSYKDNQLVIFAGSMGSVWTDELHVFDLEKGEYSRCTTHKPSNITCMVHVVR